MRDRFPLASPLFSTSSAIRLLSRILFKGFLDTIRLSDFRKTFVPVVRFSPSLAVPHHAKENSRISRFPRKECPHMPSSSTPPGRSIARIALQLMLPSQTDHVVGTQKLVISELNSPPVRFPLSTLQPLHYCNCRMTRGWCDLLNLHHKTLSFSILYRF